MEREVTFKFRQLDKFQFQLGTIGTRFKNSHNLFLIISIPVKYDWNMVLITICATLPYFNSSKVRLEPDVRLVCLDGVVFQFQ